MEDVTLQAEEWRRFALENPEVESLIHTDQRPGKRISRPCRAGLEKLAVRDVSKQFRVRSGHIEALSDVNLSVSEGEFVCLVGPSGCGKSTLLHIIAGLEHPSRGMVISNGQPIRRAGPDRILIF